MKQAFRKFAFLSLAGVFLAPASLKAQKDGKDKEKKDVEQIIITLKNGTNKKVTVDVNGEDITVNGKPLDEYKDGEITVRKNKIKDVWAFADGMGSGRTVIAGSPRAGQNFRMMSADSNKAMLGVTTEAAEDAGVVVQDITKGSGAEKAGLKEDDVITKIDDKKINSPDELSAAIQSHKPGDKVAITFLRDKKEQKATAELGKWKGMKMFSTSPDQNFDFNMEDFDLNLKDILPRKQYVPGVPFAQGHEWSRFGDGQKLGISVQDTDDGKGVKVIDVDDEGNAYKAGIKEDDIITEVDGKAVNNADEITKIIRENKDKVSINVKLQRAGKSQSIEVKMPRKLKTANL